MCCVRARLPRGSRLELRACATFTLPGAGQANVWHAVNDLRHAPARSLPGTSSDASGRSSRSAMLGVSVCQGDFALEHQHDASTARGENRSPHGSCWKQASWHCRLRFFVFDLSRAPRSCCVPLLRLSSRSTCLDCLCPSIPCTDTATAISQRARRHPHALRAAQALLPLHGARAEQRQYALGPPDPVSLHKVAAGCL